MQLIRKYILNFFKGDVRTVKAKKHIIYSFFLKGISVLVGLALVPLILKYLDAERYGIWLTLSSIIGWFSFFDIGLGNGMRNKLAEAIAINDKELGRTYVSTTYAILGIIFGLIILVFIIINPFLNWQTILNTTAITESELSKVALIVFIFFILRFFFNLIGTILMADQRPAVNNTFGPLGNLLSLFIIYILTKTTDPSLINLSTVLSVIPVLVLIIATIIFFSKDYKIYTPSLKYVDLSKSKQLLSLGVKFFFLQAAGIIFYTSTNILIAQFSTQMDVTNYNVSFKLFSIFTMLISIIIRPFWSSSTDAFVKGDYDWLKNSLKKLFGIVSSLIILLAIVLIFSNKIIYLWVGNSVTVPFEYNVVIAISVAIQLVNAPFSIMINGIGKLYISIISIVIRIVLFFPLAIFMGENYGVLGIMETTLIMRIFPLILHPVQLYLILSKKARGIWNK